MNHSRAYRQKQSRRLLITSPGAASMPTSRSLLSPPPGQTLLAARLAAPDQADQVVGTPCPYALFYAARWDVPA